MIKTELIESFLKLSSVVIFLSLEFIKSLLVSVHLVSVVLPSALLLDLMCLFHLSHLVFVHPVDFLLCLKKLLITSIIFNFFILNLLCKFIDFLLFAIKFLLNGSFLILLGNLNLVFEMFNISGELVSLLLFNQDFF